MNISIRHYPRARSSASQIIEITIESNGNTIVEDVTNLQRLVPTDLIKKFRDIADELEEQNNIITNQTVNQKINENE